MPHHHHNDNKKKSDHHHHSTKKHEKTCCDDCDFDCKCGCRCKWPIFSLIMAVGIATSIVAITTTLSPFQNEIADEACGKTLVNGLRGLTVLTIIFTGLVFIISFLIAAVDICSSSGAERMLVGCASYLVGCLMILCFIFSIVPWAIAIDKSDSTQTVTVKGQSGASGSIAGGGSTTTITVENCGLPNLKSMFVPLTATTSGCLFVGFFILIGVDEKGRYSAIK